MALGSPVTSREGQPKLDDVMVLLLVITAALAMTLQTSRKRPAAPLENKTKRRRVNCVRSRLSFQQHAAMLIREKKFASTYRMDYSSFMKLTDILRPSLHLNVAQSIRRTGEPPPSPEVMLLCAVRWLAGGSYTDIRQLAGVSESNFYSIVHRVLDAINNAKELDFNFPVTTEEQQAAAEGFRSVSEQGVIRGCIGAIDGWLCPIRVPRSDECADIISFFSGHYQRYGLNVQACADHKSRFTAVSLRAPGGMNDSLAFKAWELAAFLPSIEPGFYVIGDNAYTQQPYLMTPFNKAQVRDLPTRDNYNFFISQVRVRVEMAFGLLVNKWCILKRPLCVSLSRCKQVIIACMRLHNYCIDERCASGRVSVEMLLDETESLNVISGISYPESVPMSLNDGEPQDFAPVDRDIIDELPLNQIGVMARNALVQYIVDRNLRRPERNLRRQGNGGKKSTTRRSV